MTQRPDIEFEIPDDLVVSNGNAPSSTLPQDLLATGQIGTSVTDLGEDRTATFEPDVQAPAVNPRLAVELDQTATGILAPPRVRNPLPQDGRLPKKVLVIDDDLTARLYLRSRLMLRGHVEIYEASSGEQGVAMAGTQHFDAVLLDVDMVGTNGFETCGLIRNQIRPSGVSPPKIYVITGRSGVIDKMRAKMAGASAFLSKPPDPAELARLLKEL